MLKAGFANEPATMPNGATSLEVAPFACPVDRPCRLVASDRHRQIVPRPAGVAQW